MSRLVMYTTRSRVSTTVLLLVAISACAVRPGQLDEELEQVRQEMRESEERIGEEMRALKDRMEHRISTLEMELNELRDEFEFELERMENALRFNTPVHFAFDDATVRDQDRELLDRFAAVISEYYDEAIITVEGFTDPAGNPQYNLQLGERRAEAVLEYLAGQAIPRDRMKAVSYGEAPERQVVPGAQGPGEEGWENRRVALVIDFSAEARAPVAAMDEVVTEAGQGGKEELY